MVRSTPTGISAMIDGYGRRSAGSSLGQDVEGILDLPLPDALAPTPYSRLGDGPFFVMLLIILIIILRARRLKG